jgi:hypothetical protein
MPAQNHDRNRDRERDRGRRTGTARATPWRSGARRPTPPRSGARRATAITVALIVTLALALAGCGSSSSSSSSSSSGAASSATTTTNHTSFAKTKFVLHAGLAFGAFHRWIYKPFRAGDFRHPFSHKLTIAKAVLAAGFVKHEVRLALHDAQSSPTLSKLVSPITALDNRMHSLAADVRGGGAGLSADNGSISSIEKQSSQSGTNIQEQTPASPAG